MITTSKLYRVKKRWEACKSEGVDNVSTFMLSTRDLVKFSLLVALFAILSDAMLGHALLWENDPYWTYWITKTLLIGTVFALGTAWFGVGALRGALITLVHTIILTIYYWTFSPVGLPEEVNWLDLNHTWVTGVPIHFAVIYIGYLSALWFWNANNLPREKPTSSREVHRVLIATIAAVVVMGIASSLVVGEFVGVTWFVTRILVMFTTLLALTAFMPRVSRLALLGISFIESLILTAHSHYLSPLGLPGTWRVFSTLTPVTVPRWLDFKELWYYQFPIYFIVGLVTLWALRKWSAK
ncbi:hypothetical protein KW785_01935 [Candidatus Parcubacteria bacterium]|nr:hypothetical protein [Candidatus Parcubacteria bacterium]